MLQRFEPLRYAKKYYGFYAVFLKDTKCGELRHGRQFFRVMTLHLGFRHAL